jgi:FlaA1/EpsC-like NDP-sugar epimerase
MNPLPASEEIHGMTNMALSARQEGIDALSTLVTGREVDLFAGDIAAHVRELEDAISGRRILVVGGAGSIGSSTIHQLTRFRPRSLHVVDQNENGLAELVRDLRSAPGAQAPGDFRTLPLDYGSAIMRAFMEAEGPYDIVLNFAALKHVRSEKDAFSLLQMLNTNIVMQARFLRRLEALDFEGRYFCVSTDKAANPVNLMGASKRLMEHVVFSAVAAPGRGFSTSSTRFANVAFSAGSLLDGFRKRLEKRQPLAVPKETYRYFVSLRESGQICLLATALAPPGHTLIPRLTPESDLRSLEGIAREFLGSFGLTPEIFEDEQEARAAMSGLSGSCYPLLLTGRDTSGEKVREEFVGVGEVALEVGLDSLQGIPYSPSGSTEGLKDLLGSLEAWANDMGTVSKEELISSISQVLDEFEHHGTNRCLDRRM